MKRLVFFILLLTSLKAVADDTSALQLILDGGNVTLAAGHTYNISSPGVIVKGVVNGNNAVINYTSTTGTAVRMNTNGASLSNVTIQGPWNFSLPGDPGGGSGMKLLNNNQTVNNVRIKKFSGYGILCGGPGNFNNLTITSNTISETGYISFFYSADANGTGNSVFSGNIVDRSTLPASVQQVAVAIRGSTSNPSFVTTGWTITGNTIKMPLKPVSDAAECIEFRYGTNSTISGNICDKGSISISVVRCSNVVVRSNIMTSPGHEGVEFASCTNTQSISNTVTGSYNVGILFDGYSASPASPGCLHVTSSGDIVTGSANEAIQSFIHNSYVTIINGNLTTKNKGINLQQTDSVTIINTIINGQGISGTSGVFVDRGPANITMRGGHIINATRQVFAYDDRTNQLVDNIVFTNVGRSGTPTNIASAFTNGAHFGTNVRFLSSSLSFPPLPIKTFKDPDFNPGATSTTTLTYSSSNTSVATIVSGNIHILHAGNSNITASNGDTSIVQPLTVNKAVVTIVADNKYKPKNTPNPALTLSYISSVTGDTSPILDSYGTATTTATTGSATGRYKITPSGASSGDYNITYVEGTLTIYPVNIGPVIRGRRAAIPTY